MERKRSTWKRFLAILLATAMVFSSSSFVYAAEGIVIVDQDSTEATPTNVGDGPVVVEPSDTGMTETPVTEAIQETEAPTEPQTEAPTEPQTIAPEPLTEVPTEPQTEPFTEAPTEPLTEAPTEEVPPPNA